MCSYAPRTRNFQHALFIAVLLCGVGASGFVNGQTNGRNVRYVVGPTADVAYRQTSDKEWQLASGTKVERFEETDRDEWSVYLRSRASKRSVQLDLYRKLILDKVSGKSLGAITFSSVAVAPGRTTAPGAPHAEGPAPEMPRLSEVTPGGQPNHAGSLPSVGGVKHYWLGKPVRADQPTVLQFSVPVSQDFFSKLVQRTAPAAPEHESLERLVDNQLLRLTKNHIGWTNDTLPRGTLTFVAGNAMGETWVDVTLDNNWPQLRTALQEISKPFNPTAVGYHTAEIYVLETASRTPPNITLNVAFPGADPSSAGVSAEMNDNEPSPPRGDISTATSPRGQSAVVSGPGPVDASSRDSVPSLVPYANRDGSLDIAWQRSDGQILISTYRGNNFRQVTHVRIGNALDLLAGFTRDLQGNGYLLTAKNEETRAQRGVSKPRLRRRGILQILKLPRGVQNASLFVDLNEPSPYDPKAGKYNTQWGIYSPLINGLSPNRGHHTGRLVFGDGVLAATFDHEIPSPGDGVAHQTGSLVAVDTTGNPVYTAGAQNHCFDLRMAFDGQSFIRAQEGDQGILFSRLSRDSNGTFRWSDDKLIFRSLFAGGQVGNGWRDDLARYIRLGGLAGSDGNYLLTYAYVEKGFVSANPDIEFTAYANAGLHQATQGARLYVALIPKGVNAMPNFEPQLAPQVPGVRHIELAAPSGTNNVARPRLVDMQDGTFMVVWEEWSSQQKYLNTFAMLINGQGQVIRQRVQLPGARGQRATDAVYLPTLQRAAWVGGDSSRNVIRLHTVDANLDLRSFDLATQ